MLLIRGQELKGDRMPTVEEVELEATKLFNELTEVNKSTASMNLVYDLDSEASKKYLVGSLNLYTVITVLKKTRDVFGDDEFIELAKDWDKLVLVPFAKGCKKLLELHPEAEIASQVTSTGQNDIMTFGLNQEMSKILFTK